MGRGVPAALGLLMRRAGRLNTPCGDSKSDDISLSAWSTFLLFRVISISQSSLPLINVPSLELPVLPSTCTALSRSICCPQTVDDFDPGPRQVVNTTCCKVPSVVPVAPSCTLRQMRAKASSDAAMQGRLLCRAARHQDPAPNQLLEPVCSRVIGITIRYCQRSFVEISGTDGILPTRQNERPSVMRLKIDRAHDVDG
ncbi:hypothetical protein BR93DRAFT_608983 [Coniochaeta sp. PMI_546]|nr:hypothetical protein BR93DRAFT_608983 [Coniochaeta sp. PMI_546]